MANIERPKLKIDFDRSSQSLVINNTGDIEAINCVLLYIKNEKCVWLNHGQVFGLSPDILARIPTIGFSRLALLKFLINLKHLTS